MAPSLATETATATAKKFKADEIERKSMSQLSNSTVTEIFKVIGLSSVRSITDYNELITNTDEQKLTPPTFQYHQFNWPNNDEAKDTPAAIAHISQTLKNMGVQINSKGGYKVVNVSLKKDILDVRIGNYRLIGTGDGVIIPNGVSEMFPQFQIRVVIELKLPGSAGMYLCTHEGYEMNEFEASLFVIL